MQIISFAGFAVTSTIQQKEATEFVENVHVKSANTVDVHSIFNIDERKFEISSHFSFKSSHLLVVFGKACFIKHKKQNLCFYNTVKSSLLVTLLAHLHNNLPEASS